MTASPLWPALRVQEAVVATIEPAQKHGITGDRNGHVKLRMSMMQFCVPSMCFYCPRSTRKAFVATAVDMCMLLSEFRKGIGIVQKMLLIGSGLVWTTPRARQSSILYCSVLLGPLGHASAHFWGASVSRVCLDFCILSHAAIACKCSARKSMFA